MQHNCVNIPDKYVNLDLIMLSINKIRLHVDINMLHVKSIACWHNIMYHVNLIMLYVDIINMLYVDIIYLPCS